MAILNSSLPAGVALFFNLHDRLLLPRDAAGKFCPFGIAMNKHVWVVAAAAALVAPVLHAQGFGLMGMGKKSVTINRLLPPTVNLNGKKIKIDATADSLGKGGDTLRDLLKTKLVTLVQKDPRFVLNEINPQTVLKFSVTNYYVEQWTINAKTNNARQAYRGKIEVAYQAIDVATNTALDSENLVQTAGYDPVANNGLSEIFKSNAKKAAAEGSENETRDQLVDGIVASMAKRIAPTDEPFDAPLPGKKLEPLSSRALRRRWGALEEQADKMEKLPKADDDSYRSYLVALAKEAEAYDLTREANERDLGKRTDISPKEAQEEFERAQKDLDEAGAIYKDIITANAKEKEFRPGDTRTEQAIAIYAKIARYKEENAKAQAELAARAAAATTSAGSRAVPRATAVATSATTAGVPGAVITPLDQVLDFCTRGIDPDSIKDYIRSSDFLADAKRTGYHFSFGRDPIRLNETCKANAAVFQRMIRERLGSGTARPAKAAQP